MYDQLRPGHEASCPGGKPNQSCTCCYTIETIDILETVLCISAASRPWSILPLMVVNPLSHFHIYAKGGTANFFKLSILWFISIINKVNSCFKQFLSVQYVLDLRVMKQDSLMKANRLSEEFRDRTIDLLWVPDTVSVNRKQLIRIVKILISPL
jgi:hypothetical protein